MSALSSGLQPAEGKKPSRAALQRRIWIHSLCGCFYQVMSSSVWWAALAITGWLRSEWRHVYVTLLCKHCVPVGPPEDLWTNVRSHIRRQRKQIPASLTDTKSRSKVTSICILKGDQIKYSWVSPRQLKPHTFVCLECGARRACRSWANPRWDICNVNADIRLVPPPPLVSREESE